MAKRKAIAKVKGGYELKNIHTGKSLDKHPGTKSRAEAQLRAIEVSKHGRSKKG
jgi:hypothetical protein